MKATTLNAYGGPDALRLDGLPEAATAIGAPVSDRSVKPPTRSRPGVELDLARETAC
ncbi:hypothetical protein [Streptomyces sp. NPDC014734]|uniref:hypothetical protein n=1 Tax=Streptomyces sp. NPDC014734 TaxID=3364886 RepID=UPI0037024A6E